MAFDAKSRLNKPTPMRRSTSLTRISSFNTHGGYDSPYDLFSPSNEYRRTSVTDLRYDSAKSKNASSYTSPYTNRSRYDNTSNSYTPVYKNRFASPYMSYNNGVTTAGLNIQLRNSCMDNYPNASYLSRRYESMLNNSDNPYSKNSTLQVKRTSSLRGIDERQSRRKAMIQQNELKFQKSHNISKSITSISSEGYEVRF